MALTDAAYWILPKPADMVVMMHRLLEAGKHFTLTTELETASFSPVSSLLTSTLFALAVLGLAAWRVERAQY
jgi:hypothetical protein